MTEKLQTLLHEQATIPDFAPVDLGAITTAGERRVRRRRGAGALAGGLATLAVVGGVLVAAGGDDGTRSDAVDTPTFPAQVTWVLGSTLHTPEGEQDLGVATSSYVRTTAGLLLADRDGTVWSYVDGRATRVGSTDRRRPELAGDADGTLAGWVDTSGDRPTPTLLDLATGEVTAFPGRELVDFESFYRLVAVDGRTALWQERSGWVAGDVATGEVTATGTAGELLAVEDGVVARSTGADDAGAGGVVVERDGSDRVLPGSHASTAAFSPDARYLSIEGDALAVFDTQTGEQVDTDLSDRWFSTGVEWVDDHMLTVVTARGERQSYEMWTCDVTDGSCTPVTDLGPVSEVDGIGLALPDGLPIG